MIRISKKADYAVFLMGQLAQQEGPEQDPTQAGTQQDGSQLEGTAPSPGAALLSAQDLADHSSLNRSLVANLLKDLARAGLLESERGVNGGYRLAKPAEAISLKDILHAVEGPFLLVDCASDLVHNLGTETENCALTCLCSSRSPMRQVHQRIARMFEETSLAQLCAEVGAVAEKP